MLIPVEPFANLHDDEGIEQEETYDEEEQEEPLGIMTKIASGYLFNIVSSFFRFGV